MFSRLSPIKIIKYLLILAASGLIAWLVYVNFPLSGQLNINADFERDRPLLSRVGPAGRVETDGVTATILDSPVYFDLRALPWYRQLRIKITYQAENREFDGMGPQMGSGWDYAVAKPLSVIDEPNGDQTAVYDFDFSGVYRPKNVIRFIISTKAGGDGGAGKIIIKNLSFTLKR